MPYRAAEARSQNFFNVALPLKKPQLFHISPMIFQLATDTVLPQVASSYDCW